MSVTLDPPIGTACAPDPVSDPVSDPVALEVRVLDADAVLTEVVAQRRAAEAAEARVLMLAVHYVDLHPVSEEHPAASPAVGEHSQPMGRAVSDGPDFDKGLGWMRRLLERG